MTILILLFFSCIDILHISNLSLLSPVKLTSLKLSVNRIDKICNLDSFTNLVELDLSHNQIKTIENLQVNRYPSHVNFIQLRMYVYNFLGKRVGYKFIRMAGRLLYDFNWFKFLYNVIYYYYYLLKGLVKLRCLILNHNPLTRVENLDNQRDSLEMFDVGCCEISDLKFVSLYYNK